LILRCSEPVADAIGFVLAGGQSSRMGKDKALLEFNGRPLIARAISILEAAGLPVKIAGARPEARARLESYAAVISDLETGLGPLGGICTALAVSTIEYAVFLPVDLPFLPSSLIEYLVHNARIKAAAITLASVNGFPQTFPAVISRQSLPALQEELHGGQLGCLAAFKTAGCQPGQNLSVLPAEVLVQSGQVSHPQAFPVVRWFLNLNEERDLRWASSVRVTRVI
jgi:molybdopterin-guanine dinucleotide biosynthesis protein A